MKMYLNFSFIYLNRQKFRQQNEKVGRTLQKITESSPLIRMKDFYRQEIADEEAFRTAILRNVTAFCKNGDSFVNFTILMPLLSDTL
jgi:hypothetical protein